MPGNNENPTTKFKVDISELKAGIQESNRLIKLANSEFKAAASGMDNWANSTDGLEAKIKQLTTVQAEEEKKLANLQEQYKKTAEAEGENSKGAQELAIKINNQQAAVNKVSSELSGYEDRLDLVKRAQENAERSGNSFEDELRDLEKSLDNAGDAAEESADDGFTVLKGTLADLASSAIQGAISAVGDLVGTLMELPEATKEFRTVFGAAMQSAEDSAVGVEGAKKAFEEFYKVAADEGQAAEATSHLSGLVNSQEQLQGALNGVIGAWVEYGDSIAIEGLAEAANETAKTGQLTGQMADAINWAGESEDEFQASLDKCSTEQERQQLVVDTLNRLYGDNAAAYAESNSSILDANAANLALLESQSQMATAMEPLTAAWTNFKAQALDLITPLVEKLAGKLQEFFTYLQSGTPGSEALKAVLIGLATALGVLAAAFAIVNIISAVQKAMALLNVTMLANPFVLIAAAVAGLVAAFIYLWNTSNEFRAFFINLWEDIKSATGKAIDAVVGFFKDAIKWVKANWPSLLLMLINPFAGLFKYFYDNNTQFRDFVDTAVKYIQELPGKVWTWLKETISKVAKWKTDLIGKGKEAAQGLLTAIINKAKEIPKKIKSIGSDIVKGIWNGTNDKIGWIKDKLVGFKDAVLNKLKDVFGIHSPSKLMENEVGKNLALGVASGIEKNKKYAKKSAGELGKIVVEAATKRLDRYKTYNDMSLAAEKSYWNEVRKHVKKGTAAKLEADKKYFEVKKQLNEQIAAAEKSYTESVEQAYKDLQQNIQAAMDEYAKEVKSRAESIASSMSIFEEFTKNTEKTGQQLLTNLKSQVTGLQDWMDTLDALEKRCANSEFVQYLREMGPSAAGQVEALNRLSDDKLNEYVSLWESKNDLARQAAEKELTRLQEETANKIASLVSETEESIKGYKQTYDDALKELGVSVKKHVEDADKTLVDTAAKTIIKSAPSVGENTINGIIQGLNNRAGALYSTISGIISEAIAQAAAAAEINSPSEIMRKFIGQNLIKGVELGIGEEAKNLYNSMKGTISKVIDTAKIGLGLANNPGNMGGVVNNYTFNQTNNSPKALSRLDIYRQTRNQFRQLQEV